VVVYYFSSSGYNLNSEVILPRVLPTRPLDMNQVKLSSLSNKKYFISRLIKTKKNTKIMKLFWIFFGEILSQIFCPEECTSCGQSSTNGIVDPGLYVCSSDKRITEVPYGLPKDKIRDFRLNNNAIEKIYQHDFRGWKNMEILHLEENKITEIEPDSFKVKNKNVQKSQQKSD